MGLPGYLKSSKSFWSCHLWGGRNPGTFAIAEPGSSSAQGPRQILLDFGRLTKERAAMFVEL